MKKSWRLSGGWVTALRNKFAQNLFLTARLKILALYFLMGVVVLGVALYLVYVHILIIVRDLLAVIVHLLADPLALHRAATELLIDRAVSQEIYKMDAAVIIWLFAALILAAFLFATITLLPIWRSMEKQRRLIGNVSHELKTPLSVMKTSSEVALLDPDALTSEDLTAALHANLEEIDQMSGIVKLLLNFSTLQNRLINLPMASVDMSLMAHAALESLRPLAREKHITFAVFTEPHGLMVRGNAPALQEMIGYFIKNALVATPAHGLVTVRLEKKVRSVLLSVQDGGNGIAPEDVPHIFEPFHQMANVQVKNNNANAVFGLAIAREIAEVHHAVISVTSEMGQEGTLFTVRLAGV